MHQKQQHATQVKQPVAAGISYDNVVIFINANNCTGRSETLQNKLTYIYRILRCLHLVK